MMVVLCCGFEEELSGGISGVFYSPVRDCIFSARIPVNPWLPCFEPGSFYDVSLSRDRESGRFEVDWAVQIRSRAWLKELVGDDWF